MEADEREVTRARGPHDGRVEVPRDGQADHTVRGRGWAAQRTAAKLRSRSIVAAPGRASPRLGAVRCNRLLCQPGATTSLRARPGRLDGGPGRAP